MGIISCCAKAAEFSLLILIIPLGNPAEQIAIIIIVQIFCCSTGVKIKLIIDQYVIAFIQHLEVTLPLLRWFVFCLQIPKKRGEKVTISAGNSCQTGMTCTDCDLLVSATVLQRREESFIFTIRVSFCWIFLYFLKFLLYILTLLITQ